MVKIDKSKYNTCLKILALAIGQEMKREETRDQSFKLEILKSVSENKYDSARLKGGEIVRIRNRVAAYDILKIYVEQLQYDLAVLERSPSCPETLISNIHAIIFCSKVYAIKNLPELADLLKSTYGSKFYEEAINQTTTKADKQFVERVMFLQPTQMQLDEVTEEVKQYAQERNQKVTQYDQMLKDTKNNVETPNIPGPGAPGSSGASGNQGAPNCGGDDLEALRRRLAGL